MALGRSHGVKDWMRFAALLALVMLGCTASTSSYGTPADCTAAGGMCALPNGVTACAKQGPENTCNCNPECNPGGSFCCLVFVDACTEPQPQCSSCPGSPPIVPNCQQGQWVCPAAGPCASPLPDASTDADDGSGCVDIEPSADELACAMDRDCTLVVIGTVCPGYVPTVGSKLGTLCENGAANGSGAARIAAQLAAVPPQAEDAGFDFCDAIPGTPRCLQGQCTICGPYIGAPACFDAGAPTTLDGSP
jgi:hypothetical protein